MSHHGLCSSLDDTMPNHPNCDCGEEPRQVRELIEELCSAAVAYGELGTEDAEQAYYAAKAHLIGATAGVTAHPTASDPLPDTPTFELVKRYGAHRYAESLNEAQQEHDLADNEKRLGEYLLKIIERRIDGVVGSQGEAFSRHTPMIDKDGRK
jgi:hypothetical protein